MFTTRMRQIKTIFLLTFFKTVSYFIPKRKYWVICERGTDARDNGWHFYKYMKKCHPEIKVYYIIDKKSVDYERVKEDAVHYGSLKNYWLVVRAEKLISTHISKSVPYLGGKVQKLFPCLEDKFYFLQHGVISNYIDFLHRKNMKTNLFICGAKPESVFVNESFGHEMGVVQYTGLARYDNLHNINTKKQILVMPTWRNYIRTREEFLKSNYYIHWQELIKNQKINEILNKNGFELIFYPHYEVQKYIDCFHTDNSSIKIASFNDYDVQTLLKESKLLITDYSSVFFDFGYMKKPIVYFQFDADEFYRAHLKRGYFNHIKDVFGKVCSTYEEVVDEMQKCFENNFVLEKVYSERLEAFFPLYDQNNCQRIYQKIIEQ